MPGPICQVYHCHRFSFSMMKGFDWLLGLSNTGKAEYSSGIFIQGYRYAGQQLALCITGSKGNMEITILPLRLNISVLMNDVLKLILITITQHSNCTDFSHDF